MTQTYLIVLSALIGGGRTYTSTALMILKYVMGPACHDCRSYICPKDCAYSVVVIAIICFFAWQCSRLMQAEQGKEHVADTAADVAMADAAQLPGAPATSNGNADYSEPSPQPAHYLSADVAELQVV